MSGFLHFINAYGVWHYTTAVKQCMHIWRNFIWFLYHFFSIPTLVRTLFVPWHRLHEEYDGGLHIQEWLTAKVVNGMMRLVGACMRTAVILFGLVVEVIVIVGGAAVFTIWLALPVVIITLLFVAEYLLF